MADFSAKAPKLLLPKGLRQLPESGTLAAQGAAPVVCPELAKPSTEIDDIDIDA